MRIISGKYKGRRILAPKELPIRPTTDMAKEALFNILNNDYYFEDISVLDLYAGSGNISFEFASRGTPRITSVDKDYRCIKFIKRTATELQFNIEAIKSEVLKFLEKTDSKFHIVFADPPYQFSEEEFTKIHDVVFKCEILLENGILIIEHSKHTDLSSLTKFSNSRKYGGSVFSFFEG